MNAAVALMFGLCLVGVGISWGKGDGVLREALQVSLTKGGKFMPLILMAILLMGFTETLLPTELVKEWLSDSAGTKGILVAWAAGAVTPGGSLVGLPLVAGLSRAGASAGVLITYLSSLSLLSIIKFPVELGFFGPRLFGIRVLVALFVPPALGMLTQVVWRLWNGHE